MAQYVVQSDLENALSPATVLAIFDDTNTRVVNAAAIEDVCTRASAHADSWVASVYRGPFPITFGTIPAMLRELALTYAISFTFERHPDYVRTFGEQPRAERWKRADEMGQRIQAAVLRMPDFTAQPVPGNAGGIIYDSGPRTILDGADGTSRGGDF